MTVPPAVADVAFLLGRVLLGVILIAHGWQKLVTNGIKGTSAFFDQSGVPMPTLSAWFAAIVELVGGAALVVGFLVPVAAALVVLDMLGAYLFVHVGQGLFIDKGGFELVGLIAAGALLLLGAGSGRYSIDHVLRARSRRGAAVRV
jgi:putative oxidoreductase